MMAFETFDRVRMDEPRVAAHLVDGEAIVIDFETGSYFSARDVGAYILELLLAGASVGQIEGQVHQSTGAEPAIVAGWVHAFLASLEAERLIVVEKAAEAPPFSAAPKANLSPNAPVLEKFTDVASLLLLDPIHDADTTGWPRRAERS
jgi:hypothetical protein